MITSFRMPKDTYRGVQRSMKMVMALSMPIAVLFLPWFISIPITVLYAGSIVGFSHLIGINHGWAPLASIVLTYAAACVVSWLLYSVVYSYAYGRLRDLGERLFGH